MLDKFGLSDCKSTRTPVGSDVNLFDASGPVLSADDIQLYQQIVGGLNYLVNGSRSDLAFTVNCLCRFMASPRARHLETAKRVLRFVSGTKGSYVKYESGDFGLRCFTDADHANCTETSKSVSGVCFTIGCNLVSWSSYKQSRVATSTCESETLSILDGVNESEFVFNLIKELQLDDRFKLPVIIYNDNKAAGSSVENGGVHKSNKHYKTRLNRIRRAEADGLVKVIHENGIAMISDVFTKNLSFERSTELLKLVNVFVVKRN